MLSVCSKFSVWKQHCVHGLQCQVWITTVYILCEDIKLEQFLVWSDLGTTSVLCKKQNSQLEVTLNMELN